MTNIIKTRKMFSSKHCRERCGVYLQSIAECANLSCSSRQLRGSYTRSERCFTHTTINDLNGTFYRKLPWQQPSKFAEPQFERHRRQTSHLSVQTCREERSLLTAWHTIFYASFYYSIGTYPVGTAACWQSTGAPIYTG